MKFAACFAFQQNNYNSKKKNTPMAIQLGKKLCLQTTVCVQTVCKQVYQQNIVKKLLRFCRLPVTIKLRYDPSHRALDIIHVN